MSREFSLLRISTFLGLQLIAACALFAAQEVAHLHASGGVIEWQPQVDSEELTLRLSGPDGVVQSWRFPAGSVPSLALVDEGGQPLPDGLYVYEIRATPRLSQELARTLQEARSARDGVTVRQLQSEIPEPTVQAGTFRIAGGAVLAEQRPEVEAGSPVKDQMVPDDLIVDGKGCVGLGCANGESFGAEALRLKQSVVRLRFEDTSTSAGFPTRDWQLTVNDSNSGGADRFSIEDLTANRTPFTLRGNAPDNALVIDSGGKVGLRTATPAQDIHIASGNTPALRLEQTTAGGFPGRTWDLGANDTSFFVRDVTAGSANSLTIQTNGKAGIGTASPAERFHVFENADVNTIITAENPNTGLTALGALRAKSNSATVNFQAHGSGRTISRFGQTLASWAEFLQVTGNGLIIGTLLDKPLILGTNSANRLQISPTGDVGIGTTAPASKLHVNGGDIRVSGGSFIDVGVTVIAPDYVFDPTYSLMPVEQLRDFVTREKHLPNVPTAGEMKQNGLNLGQLQLKLLEKVEELTLYTIDQQDQIKSQRQLIHDLEERLAHLEVERR